MNCKQLNSIGLEEVLVFLGHLPTRQNEKEVWYLSPFGSESQASFKVDKPKNLWYLFSEGVGGTTTDFIQKYFNISVKGALEWASNQDFSFHQQIKTSRSSLNYHIDRIININHPNLVSYLHERGLSEKVYPFIKELWFTIENKQLYAIGFKNNSEGWELRNSFYKGALHKKDITVLSFPKETESVSNNETKKNAVNQKITVFEGFTDALSFIEMQKSFVGDLLVLNSIAMIKSAIDILTPYSEINLFLDNDESGRNCTNMILRSFPYAKDFSHLYSNHKDLNQHLVAKRQMQVLPDQKTEDTKKTEKGREEQQKDYNKETNRIKKGMRRRM